MKRTIHHRMSAVAAKLGLALAIGLAGAGAAHAGDFCLDYSAQSGTTTIVGKGFKMPKAGKCKELVGFSTVGAATRTVAGPVCTSSDGTHATFGLTGVTGNVALYYTINLPMPAMSGGTISVFTNTGAMQLVGNPVGYACNPTIEPVP